MAIRPVRPVATDELAKVAVANGVEKTVVGGRLDILLAADVLVRPSVAD